ncbi:hypothetical protein [Flavobacterium chungangense]|uniref:Uncharacterized protein n=1 Tax=Flavobacterium chungangense TaxID=554283 RepID=A0A6V6ZDN3_9FLAO|nr:hypothetical protein [Flavobacterium chungangense]CAD0009656.1 hypothetical protein FLACHUCJ7_04336 [Flavobacterium chungangense]
MKAHIRILIYSVLFLLYLISTSLLLLLSEKLGVTAYITLGCGFTALNIVYSFIVLKWIPLLNVACSIVIALLSLFLALRFGELELFPNNDPYGIITSIIANAVFSIVFWEAVFQLKKKTSVSKTLS